MADTMREKLIELLTDNLPRIGDLPKCDNPLQYTMDEIVRRLADHLIANGVTVQQWIPVSERLPDEDSHVLAYLRIGEEGRIYPASYAKGVWWDCIFSTPATKTTTHWMPLPEPPKGE